MASEHKWDLFLSHATEDMETVVVPLIKALSKYPIKVWIDNKELRIGDSLMGKINEGIAKSRYGLVILSLNFFAKTWTKRELEMLLKKEEDGNVVILPVWHDVTEKDVKSFNLFLATKIGVRTSIGFDNIAAEIVHILWPGSNIDSFQIFTHEIKYINLVVNFLIRASNVSDVITILIPDAPRYPREFEYARDFIWDNISKRQPNRAQTDIPRNIALEIKNIESVDPFALLGDWVSVGMLSYALGDYENLYNVIKVVQEVACQYRNEEIWIAGAKYSFGLSVFFLMQNIASSTKSINQEVHAYCQQLIMSSAEGSYIGDDARFLSMAFHEMAFRLWECKYDADELRHSVPDDLMNSVKELSLALDSRTDFDLDLAQWLATTFFDSFRTTSLFTKRPE